MHDFIIIGAGIVGASVAYTIKSKNPRASVLILEKEPSAATHQTGRNSGVIHSGIYYPPGSLKSRLCKEGIERLKKFCRSKDIHFEQNGKLVVATNPKEKKSLEKIIANATATNTPIEELNRNEIAKRYPMINGYSAIRVASTGTIDYREVCIKLIEAARERGLEVRFNSEVNGISENETEVLVTTKNAAYPAKKLVVCGGLYSDTLSKQTGKATGVTICPVKGKYFNLRPGMLNELSEHIYPTPNLRYPFLGIHFTKTLGRDFHIGPNAVLALAREDYGEKRIKIREAIENFTNAGTLRFITKNIDQAISEALVFLSKSKFLKEAQKLIPDIREDDLLEAPCGIRAQAIYPDGTLLDDFHFAKTTRSIHVVNAPSPAATSSLAIADYVVSRI